MKYGAEIRLDKLGPEDSLRGILRIAFRMLKRHHGPLKSWSLKRGEGVIVIEALPL